MQNYAKLDQLFEPNKPTDNLQEKNFMMPKKSYYKSKMYFFNDYSNLTQNQYNNKLNLKLKDNTIDNKKKQQDRIYLSQTQYQNKSLIDHKKDDKLETQYLNIKKNLNEFADLSDDKKIKQKIQTLELLIKPNFALKDDQYEHFLAFQQFSLKCVKDLNGQIIKLKNDLKCLDDDNKNKNIFIDQLEKKIVKLQNKLKRQSETFEDLQNKIQDNQKRNYADDQRINKYQIESAQLRQILKIETQNMQQMMLDSNVSTLDETKKQLQKVIEDKDNQQIQYEGQIAKLKQKIDVQIQELNNCNLCNDSQLQIIKDLEQKLNKFENMIPKEDYMQLKEIALMQFDDYLCVIEKEKYLLELLQNQKEKIKYLTNNLRLFQQKVNPDQIKQQIKQVELLTSHLQQSEFSYQIKNILESSMQTGRIEEPDWNQKLYFLQYLKPSFFQLIEKTYKIYNMTTNVENQEFNQHYLQVVRAILDSKYNEYLIYDDHRQFTKFPEFVYSWLYTFKYCPKELKIQYNEDIDEMKIMEFYKFIEVQSQNLWEVLTFLEFLNDECTSDEIFFYLNCRFILMKGQMLDNQASNHEAIILIHFNTAKYLADKIFGHFEMAQQKIILDKLIIQSKKKNDIRFIDLAYVLRVFLEFYRKECILRLSIIQKVFATHPQIFLHNQVPGFNYFKSFQNFLDVNFPGISLGEQAQIFRDCYSLGKGHITSQVFYTVANETNFFTKILKQRSLTVSTIDRNQDENKSSLLIQNIKNKKPKFEKSIDGELPAQIPQEKIDQFIKTYKFLQQETQTMIKIVENYGIEKVKHSLKQYYEYLQEKIDQENITNLNDGMNGFLIYQKLLNFKQLARGIILYKRQQGENQLNQQDIINDDGENYKNNNDKFSEAQFMFLFDKKKRAIAAKFISSRFKQYAKCIREMDDLKNQISKKVKAKRK